MTKTLTPKELAQAIGTDPKTVRKFLRSDEATKGDAPGKGGRWAIEASKVRSLKGRFAKWDAARREEIARRAAERAEAARDAADAPEVTEDEVDEVETLED